MQLQRREGYRGELRPFRRKVTIELVEKILPLRPFLVYLYVGIKLKFNYRSVGAARANLARG